MSAVLVDPNVFIFGPNMKNTRQSTHIIPLKTYTDLGSTGLILGHSEVILEAFEVILGLETRNTCICSRNKVGLISEPFFLFRFIY